MFGKKQPSAEIDLGGVPLGGAQEFLRMWNGQGVTCLIEPRALGADPALFGMALADAVRHGAKAYAHAVGISEAQALDRIWQGLDAERSSPTDEPRQIS